MECASLVLYPEMGGSGLADRRLRRKNVWFLSANVRADRRANIGVLNRYWVEGLTEFNMKMRVIIVTLAACVVLGGGRSNAETVFLEDFSTVSSAPLIGLAPTIGSAWSRQYGVDVTVNGAVDTYAAGWDSVGAIAGFTKTLGAGQTLSLTFDTLAGQGDFFTSGNSGYAGISLFAGPNDEKVFLGKPGYTTYWGTDGAIGQHTFDTIDNAAQQVHFDYVYDTGAWTYTVGNQSASGTTDASIPFDRLRIGSSDGNSEPCDISLSLISVSVIPEPSSLALIGLICIAGFLRRRMQWK